MEKAATRDGFGKGLLELGEKNLNVVSLEADLGKSTKSDQFRAKYPERTINVGISEQDMMSTAAGLAASGKIPFASTFAIFTERGFEQIRNAICRPNLNVKIIGSHAGIITGEDGSSAQSIEDIAIFRALPNMTVLSPADSIEAEKLTIELSKHNGPAYLRLTREKVPILSDEKTKVEIGKGIVLKDGTDVCIIATGPLVAEALQAHDLLENEDISAAVINMHTIKPLDKKLIIKYAKKTKRIVTCEDHNVIGGLGGAVAETLCEEEPCIMERIGVQDVFGESGKPSELYQKYGLTAEHIVSAVKRLVKKKKNG